MGYQSTGACRIEGKEDEIMHVLGKLRLTYHDQTAWNEVLDIITINRKADGFAIVGFDIDNWKWYGSYSDVQALEAFWNAYAEASEDKDSTLTGAFLRIGENDDDVEQRSFGEGDHWDLVSYQRTYDAVLLDPESDIRHNLSSTQDNKENASGDHIMEPLEADGLREVQVPVLAEARPEDPGAGTPAEAGAD